ncbi:protein phosphatase 2C domain-containing protein [Saccharothrix sp. 6-C]|uniref:protein phosphatase 2C domain-containing protein n=1 Tax=Saccharothrix sp. 6-C TaxID=2781735 RepID=UPI001916EAF7|nr:protein phosphatase 2C domain-containing protein [Saccharothrix sp. 6-C]QQQ78167.1 protein phosphatase 2C domain-containing protein [Saccharothrix sp. 6-C]
MRTDHALSWRTVHHSTTGAAHLNNAIGCQDSSASRVLDDGRWAYAVVADGHGSERYFRSERGAAFAVQVVEEVITSFRDRLAELDGEPTIGALAELWQAESAGVVPRWRELVHADLVADPPLLPGPDGGEPGVIRFLDKFVADRRHTQNYQLYLQLHWFAEYARELRDLAPASLGPLPLPTDPTWNAAKLGSWQARAYGTTVLAVLIGPRSMHWIRLGDGAMVEIVGGKARHLVGPPAEAFANETPSLCEDDADLKIVIDSVPIEERDVPSAVILTTDGLPNSYEDGERFLGFCEDLADRARSGADLAEGLSRWLPELSRRGSGDDMTVALAWATELPSRQTGDPDPSAATEPGPERLAPTATADPLPAADQVDPAVEEHADPTPPEPSAARVVERPAPADRPGGPIHEVVVQDEGPEAGVNPHVDQPTEMPDREEFDHDADHGHAAQH